MTENPRSMPPEDAASTPGWDLLAVWSLRGLLALLLIFACEGLLWSDLPGRPAEWPLLLVGYGVLGTLALDLAARFRIRDVYGAMQVMLVIALLTALLLNPERALSRFPDHLISRTLGAYGLVALLAFGAFLALTSGADPRYRARFAGFGVGFSFFAGIWARDAHTITGWSAQPADLAAVMLTLAALIAAALLLVLIAARTGQRMRPPDLRLPPVSLLALIALLLGLLLFQAVRSQYDGAEALTIIGLASLLWTLLWYERRPRGRALLDAHIPPQPIPPGWLALILLVAAGGFVLGWSVPRVTIAGYNPLELVQLGFVMLGFFWLPLVLLASAVTVINRQMRKLNRL
ncbi:MAG: hypothetical protein ACOCYT_04355 [Chloroflexota bacterium]